VTPPTAPGPLLLPVLAPPCACPGHAANRPRLGDQLPAGLGPAVIRATFDGRPGLARNPGWPPGRKCWP